VNATRAYVGLGANLVMPERQIAVALHRLADAPGVSGLRSSRLYRTPPWGKSDQPDFVNAAACLDYLGSAQALLDLLLCVEREAGRVRTGDRWGPRPLDLDLLAFGEQHIESASLQLPHPRLSVRAFVLVPLAELSPDLDVSGIGRVADLLSKVDVVGIAAIN
jgi:2-amino-4-hydroxy-6-hydroxymethyldihydropteridine diphosphokinase